MQNYNQSATHVYRSPKTEVRESPIQGVGLFAKYFIPKGEIISIKTGHIVQGKDLPEVEKITGDFWFQVRDDFYLTPLTSDEAKETSVFINHSCDPNVGVDGDIGLVAIKDIKPGEELCYDYAMDSSDPDYAFECNCKSKQCRKTVTGNDWKNKDLQKKYGINFAWYILKKIKGWV